MVPQQVPEQPHLGGLLLSEMARKPGPPSDLRPTAAAPTAATEQLQARFIDARLAPSPPLRSASRRSEGPAERRWNTGIHRIRHHGEGMGHRREEAGGRKKEGQGNLGLSFF